MYLKKVKLTSLDVMADLIIYSHEISFSKLRKNNKCTQKNFWFSKYKFSQNLQKHVKSKNEPKKLFWNSFLKT